MSKNRQARRAAAAKVKRQRRAASPHPAPTQSQSRGRQAVRAFDNFTETRDRLGLLAEHVGEWAGLPMPIEGERLIVEPTYPWAKVFEPPIDQLAAEDDGWRLRNQWYSRKWRCDILLMEKEGRIEHGKLPAFHHIDHDLRTMGCSVAWGIEQEHNALNLLAGMLRHHAFKKYLLTGMFLETSSRSGVTYLFRKLKPTVAIAPMREGQGMRILAALCMHPIAYYAGSWAGAMCPTDDVIAHLSLMRGDERLFWARCNQHPPYRPEAGL